MASKERYTIPKSSHRRRRLAIPIAIITVILLALTFLLFVFKPFQNKSADNSHQSPRDDTRSESVTQPGVKGDSQSQSNPTKTASGYDALIDEKTPPKYEGSGATTDSITGIITYANSSQDKFMIRVSLDQYLSEGVCELTLSGPSSYTATASVTPEASTSTCQGFDIPLTSLSNGEYDIRINITSGSLAGTLTGKGAI